VLEEPTMTPLLNQALQCGYKLDSQLEELLFNE
jgi:hypothetical protein